MRDHVTGSQLDVVICTYNNASLLDRVLHALAAQIPTVESWGVLVVDNNCSDGTRDVVERHVQVGKVPLLRHVSEPEQGLTPARRRGVLATTAPWIAFVDDDCLLCPGWVEHVLDFARSHPSCGGFGGRVVPTYIDDPPPVLAKYGWAFAEQNLGAEPVPVDCLVGAGMVLSRSALDASGWTQRSFFADRKGRKLLSGGDVEIALRVASVGRTLWYTPGCQITHIIPPSRTSMGYLVRMTHGLGVSTSLARALTWDGAPGGWTRTLLLDLRRSLMIVLRTILRTILRRLTWQDAALSTSYECGRWIGSARITILLSRRRCDFFGQAQGIQRVG